MTYLAFVAAVAFAIFLLFLKLGALPASGECAGTAPQMPALIVDPGHGGEDGGTVAPDGTAEAELNLSISRGRQRQDRDDGIRDVYIMKNVSCTAVLAECGFLSNPGDLALLKSDNHQKRLASAPAAAYLSTCLLTEAG